MKTEPTAGAMRAAEQISSDTGKYRSDESLLELALLIDRETGVSELRRAWGSAVKQLNKHGRTIPSELDLFHHLMTK